MTEQAEQPTVFDSDRQHLGGVYAKALLGATEKQGSTDEALQQLGSFLDDVLEKLPSLSAVLTSPRVSHEEKVAILDKAFRSRMNPLLLNFLKVISRHGRMDCLRAIHAELLKQYSSLRGRIDVQVETAMPLDESLLAEMTQRLKETLQADVDLRTRVNPEIVGGVVIRVGDTVYDGSVSNQLRRFQDAAMVRTRHQLRTAIDRFAVSD
jgi:F-type H+-transporting ATPase subunit delta